MISKDLEDRNSILFAKLVPSEGKCETLEGEMLRAINRIIYRYYNDGDYWFEGYGCETAGPAEAFLRKFSTLDLSKELKDSDGVYGEKYEECLENLLEKILDYVESLSIYSGNPYDMLSCESKYQEEEPDDYD